MKSSKSTGNFMEAKDEAACLNVSKGEVPYSQRALAILALNDGNTRAEAAELSGLSIGQVGYWIARYRTMGMEIFPKTLIGAEDPLATVMAEEVKPVKPAKKKKSKKPEKKKKSKKAKKGGKNKTISKKKLGSKSKSKAGSNGKAKKSKSGSPKSKKPAKKSSKKSSKKSTGKSGKKPVKKSKKK